MRRTGYGKISRRSGQKRPEGVPHMSQGHAIAIRRVRWPFRVRAALICAAGLAAVGGAAIALLFDSRLAGTERLLWTLRLLVMLPAMLWLLRLCAHVVR